MRRFLRRWLNDSELARRGGAYEGVVSGVVEELVRNRYTAQRETQPVIVFDDGWRLIPNLSMRMSLIEMLGAETDAWVGRRVRVFRRQVERGGKTTWVKTVMCADTFASEPVRWRPTVVAKMEVADYDDSDDALAVGER